MDIKIIYSYTITAGDIHIKPEIEHKNHQFRHNTECVKFENESNLECFSNKTEQISHGITPDMRILEHEVETHKISLEEKPVTYDCKRSHLLHMKKRIYI